MRACGGTPPPKHNTTWLRRVSLSTSALRLVRRFVAQLMVRSSQVVRVSDSLPLAQSVDEDQSSELTQCKQQAKILFRKITPQSETRCSIDTGALSMQYVVATYTATSSSHHRVILHRWCT